MIERNLCLICDDNYCLPTAVCIQSIVDSISEDVVLNIFVCTFGLNERNSEFLISMGCKNIKVFVELFQESIIIERLQSIIQKSHVTPTALIKFELPVHFSHLDNILYLDSDIIVKSDISDLLSLDISNYYIAASFEFWDRIENIMYKFPWNRNEEFYFNSGVMLMNLEKMREDNLTEKLWDYKLNKAKTKLMDQESLNKVCSELILPLSIKWNFNPKFLTNMYIKEINNVYEENYKSATELKNDIKIIHYVGKTDKPWIYRHARMREYWDHSFRNIYQNGQLQFLSLKEFREKHVSKLSFIVSMLKNRGVEGLVCFVVYKLKTLLIVK